MAISMKACTHVCAIFINNGLWWGEPVISENESNILVTSVFCISHKKLQINLETFKNKII